MPDEAASIIDQLKQGDFTLKEIVESFAALPFETRAKDDVIDGFLELKPNDRNEQIGLTLRDIYASLPETKRNEPEIISRAINSSEGVYNHSLNYNVNI